MTRQNVTLRTESGQIAAHDILCDFLGLLHYDALPLRPVDSAVMWCC